MRKLSIIVATRNRAHAIISCLDSIAASLAAAAAPDAEIVVVDNGSEDQTSALVEQWVNGSSFPVQVLSVPKAGVSRAHNLALRTAQGEHLAFTDDDCCLGKDHVNDLLRHAAADTELVLRGGRVELGDPTDLPLTIKTTPDRIHWNRRMNSARHQPISGQIHGCNMNMHRAVVEKLGPFDERFGPGSLIGSGNDTDYLFRAYLAYINLEYVPDMTVVHFHGRKTTAQGRKLLQGYLFSNGAEYAKHGWKDPNLCRPFFWDVKNAIKEILAGGISTTSIPYFSHRDKVACATRGAIRYLFLREKDDARRLWDEERDRELFSSPATRKIEALEAQGYRLHHREGDEYHFVKEAVEEEGAGSASDAESLERRASR
jgi:GT2 family glycosyltransferase